MKTEELMACLHKRYSDKYALLEQVPNGTASNKRRTADAIAMGLWKETGFRLHGFELKVSRSDWLKELQDVNKANTFVPYCDHWWLVSPREIVNPSELPAGWGWLVPKGDSLAIAAQPMLRPNPAPVDRHFLAAIFRVLQRTDPNQERIEEAHRRGFREGFEAGKSRDKTMDQYTIRKLEADNASLQKTIADFKKASGINLDEWRSGDIGEIVGFLRQYGVTVIESLLQKRIDFLAEETKRAESSLEQLRQLLESAKQKRVDRASGQKGKGKCVEAKVQSNNSADDGSL